MISLLLLLFLADPGGRPCKKETGKAQCVTVERRHEKLYKCRASCYTLGEKPDGGFKATILDAQKPSEDSCVAELDRQAANGCRP